MTYPESKKAAYDMLYFCGCALGGIVPDKSRAESADLGQLYGMSEYHSLSAAVCTALESAGVSDKRFLQAKAKAIRKNLLLDSERARITDFMDKNGIWYMPLKGVLLKELYPQIGMRQMSDNDILFDRRFQKEIKDFMLENGYTAEHFGKGNHDIYQKPPIYNFEMHVSLFGENHDEKLFEYYSDIKERLIPDESGCGYRFSDEDFYIYITAHEYKHFSEGGTGLRSLADRYVYLRAKGGMDMGYIETELEKLGIADFERKARSLCMKIFSAPEGFCENDLSAEEKETLEYILLSGTHGNLQNGVSNRLKAIQSDGGEISAKTKLKYIFRRIFPEPLFFKTFYPFFYRHKFLLPIGYVYRIFKGLFTSARKFASELKILSKS